MPKVPQKSRRSGGPKSPEGKAKSSKNALKHGLAINAPATVSEQEVMQGFIHELVDFYQPQSPLEKMQIERIALCRAKLARLYAVESARLQIEINKLKNSPNFFFEKMPHVKGLIKGMTLEYIQFGDLTLPFKLTESELIAVVEEIQALQGQVIDEAGLWNTAPHLKTFLDRQVNPSSKEDLQVPRLARLERILQHLESIEEQGEQYMEHVKAVYSVFEPLLNPREEDNPEGYEELLQLVNEQQKALAAEYAKRHQKANLIPVMAEAEAERAQQRINGLLKKCQIFARFYFANQEAKRMLAQYTETRALMLGAVSLPTAEADTMLRYQTTWERRLSSAMGELLELLRRR